VVAVCCSVWREMYRQKLVWILKLLHLWSVLQCVAECCSKLECVAVCVWHRIYCRSWPVPESCLTRAVCCSVVQCGAVCCSVLQCVAVCCSVMQCVAVYCSVLQCGAVCCIFNWPRYLPVSVRFIVLQCVAVSCSVLQFVAVCCSMVSD